MAGIIARLKAQLAERELDWGIITETSVTAPRGLKQLVDVPVTAGEPTEIDV